MRTTLVIPALLAGFALGLALGPPRAARPATAQQAVQPGVWRAEMGDFTRLVSAVAFAEDDVWAAGDGIVHFDGVAWRQVLDAARPEFNAIDGPSSTQLWAVGESGEDACEAVGMMYRYDGAAWRPEDQATHAPLYGIDMVSATSGWAVGGIGLGAAVRYDGRAWRVEDIPQVPGLRAVQALASGEVWAVGDRGAILRFDGRDWEAIPGPGFADLTALSIHESGFGWAVGFDRKGGGAVTLRLEDGRWSLDSFNEMPRLLSVQTLSPDLALAVGDHGVLMRHDGTAWRETGRTHPGGFDPWLLAADPDGAAAPNGQLPPDERWAEGMLHSLVPLEGRERFIAVGDDGQVVALNDASQWTELHVGHELLAIDMLSADYGWVVGTGGAPLRWDGQAWAAPPAPPHARWLSDVEVVARDDVWAAGYRGTLMHWDGAAWTEQPGLTWLDLGDLSFSGPDDGWLIAQGEGDPFSGSAESFVYRWDGSSWRLATRICGTSLQDVVALSKTSAWFAPQPSWGYGGPGESPTRMLHFDGRGFSWHPVLGQARPDGPAASPWLLAAGADGSLWGIGQGIARYVDGAWRTVETNGFYWSRAGGADASGFWAVSDNVVVRYTLGQRSTSLALPNYAFNDLAVLDAPGGGADLWLVGSASTLVRYRAPSREQPFPAASATPVLPEPVLRATPTPASVWGEDEALERVLARVDPEGSGDVRVDSLRLITLAEWNRFFGEEFLELPGDGEGLWHYEFEGEFYPCRQGPDHPVWLAELSSVPNCASHAFVVLDGLGGTTYGYVCYPRRVASLYLPLALMPKVETEEPEEPGFEPTRGPRNLTPEPMPTVQGSCPTRTPQPPDEGEEP